MRRAAAFLSILVFGFFSGCTRVVEVAIPEDPASPQYIEPGVQAGNKDFSQDSINPGTDIVEPETLPQIDPGPDWVLLRVVNVNLDFDPNEEQLIVVKPRGLPDSVIHIIIADFDTVRGTYRKTWESDTNAVNIRTFNIIFEDMVGDHNLEIIAFGMNAEGERTLDVFRKTHAPTGIGLYYSGICNIVSDGTIEIVSLERTQAYELKQKNGISFPIVSYIQDQESGNVMDLLKITYYWKYQSGIYEKGKEERIPGKKIEERQLQELFSKGEDAYEDYLDGPWLKVNIEGSSTEISKQDIITFDKEERRITFYSVTIQEPYIWESSHRTRIVNSMYINVSNENVPFIGKQISLFLESLDNIHIRISDNDFKKRSNPWDGAYVRLKQNLVQQAQHRKESPQTVMRASDLAGFYTSDTGMELTFEFPRFVLQDSSGIREGGYALYTLNDLYILELVVIDTTGLAQDTLTYGVDYTTQSGDTTINHILTLTPGLLGVYGFKPREEDTIRFEQIEIIEQEDS